jgi:glycine/D-amino acid oxidase-like deaminating enzyme
MSLFSWLCSTASPFFWRNNPSLAVSPAVTNAANPIKSQHRSGEDNDAVVIVGGGIIGLCTAYNLAKETHKATTGSKRKITVLEARSSTFTAASSHNTGCLHYYFPELFGKDITPLGKYSFELWQSIAQSDAQFAADTGYRAQSFFPIILGSGKDEKALPNWVAAGEDWDVDWGSRGVVCATVNPKGIGEWLQRECSAMGVEIRTSTTVVSTILSKSGVIEGIKCYSTKTGDISILPCHKLVLTAGPWTPSQVKTLFPASTLDLQPSTNAGDWVILQNINPLDTRSIAVAFFDEIVHEKLEFAGRNDGSIWACGRRNYTAVLPPPGKEDEPDDSVISDLINYSWRFIRTSANGDGEKSIDLPILAKGRCFRPSTILGLPFISDIPSKCLFSSDRGHSTPSGVFICYGHGSYGIALGMGSGKLMAQLILKEKPDIDISKFTITYD